MTRSVREEERDLQQLLVLVMSICGEYGKLTKRSMYQLKALSNLTKIEQN